MSNKKNPRAVFHPFRLSFTSCLLARFPNKFRLCIIGVCQYNTCLTFIHCLTTDRYNQRYTRFSRFCIVAIYRMVNSGTFRIAWRASSNPFISNEAPNSIFDRIFRIFYTQCCGLQVRNKLFLLSLCIKKNFRVVLYYRIWYFLVKELDHFLLGTGKVLSVGFCEHER